MTFTKGGGFTLFGPSKKPPQAQPSKTPAVAGPEGDSASTQASAHKNEGGGTLWGMLNRVLKDLDKAEGEK